MSIRYTEAEENTGTKQVVLDTLGRLPAINGANITNLPISVTSITNNFDSFVVENVSTNITASVGKLYMVEGTCTINMPAVPSSGKRIAFLIVNPSATLSLVMNVGSSGTGTRMCISGLQYGNSLANTDMAWGYAGTTTYTLSGLGKSLHFTSVAGGSIGLVYSCWLCLNHTKMFENTAGTAIRLGYANVARPDTLTVLGAPESAWIGGNFNAGTMSFRGGSGTTLSSGTTATQGGSAAPTNPYTSPAGNFVPRMIANGIGHSGSSVKTATITINLTTISNAINNGSLPETPVIIRTDNKGDSVSNGGALYSPSYVFVDTTGGGTTTFQQIRIDASTTVNAPNIFDYYTAPTGVARPTKIAGVELWYDKTQRKWYLIRQILKGDV